jgi:hypothetical protein
VLASSEYKPSNITNSTITHISQGLLETLYSLSTPIPYKDAVRSVKLLKDFLTVERGEEFRKKVIAKYTFDKVTSNSAFLDMVLYKAISDKQKADKVYQGDKDYSIGM